MNDSTTSASTASTAMPSPTTRCSCGRFHPVAVDEIVIDASAISKLVEFVGRENWSNPFIVMDANTADVLGARVVSELGLGGNAVRYHCYPERIGLLADESGVERLEVALGGRASDVLISVGSGVITDLTRFVAHRQGKTFISVPTAASMDGYASGVAAMEFRGMKTTSVAVAPKAIFADPAVIADAPDIMTRSGIGDLLGKASAHTDWRLAHGLFGEELCEVVERRVAEPMIDVALHVKEVVERSPSSTSQLLRGLIESGIAMAMLGSSRPASGCEHHASHFWDLLAQREQHHHAPHGLQVGFATHFALRLQRWALSDDRNVPLPPGPRVPESEEARSWFVDHGAQVDAVLAEKEQFRREHEGRWPSSRAEWERVQAGTSQARGRAGLVDDALSAAGIPFEVGYLGLDATTISATFLYANRIRSRYTVIDFLESQGLLAEAITVVMNEIGLPFSR